MDQKNLLNGWRYVEERPLKPYVVTVSEQQFVARHILDVDLTDGAIVKEYDTLAEAEAFVSCMSRLPHKLPRLFLRILSL